MRRSDGTVLRVLAPGKAAGAGLFSTTYLDPYIASAWNAYTSKTLTVVPFGDQPNLKYFGRTSGTTMRFTNASGQQVASFNRPSSADVWGCDGALRAPNDQVVGPIARTLCAALNRGTLGTVDTQPSTDASAFYKSEPDQPVRADRPRQHGRREGVRVRVRRRRRLRVAGPRRLARRRPA